MLVVGRGHRAPGHAGLIGHNEHHEVAPMSHMSCPRPGTRTPFSHCAHEMLPLRMKYARTKAWRCIRRVVDDCAVATEGRDFGRDDLGWDGSQGR